MVEQLILTVALLSSFVSGHSIAKSEPLTMLRFACDEDCDNCTVISDNRSGLYPFKYYYFNNMSYNFGNNEFGSCGYVAMAMLLTYFDTCFDDLIVPESYEVKGNLTTLDFSSCSSSPGSYREISCPYQYRPFVENVNGEDVTNYSLYKSWLSANYYYTSLHARLIVDYCDTSPYAGPWVGPSTFSYVFSSYFSSINYSNYTYIRSPVGSTSSQVKAWVIDQIVNYNRPVILGRSGHVAIAYDYDSSLDIVYVHNGWIGHSRDAFNFNFDDAHTLIFTGQHNHSDNYLYNNSYYCVCQVESHTHVFDYSYSLYNDYYHYNSCYCGYTILEEHSLVVFQYKPKLILCCSKCGYLTLSGGL